MTFRPYTYTLAVSTGQQLTGTGTFLKTRDVWATGTCCALIGITPGNSSSSSSSLHCHDVGHVYLAKPVVGEKQGRRVFITAWCQGTHPLGNFAMAMYEGFKNGRPLFFTGCCIPPPNPPYFKSVFLEQRAGRRFYIHGQIGEVGKTNFTGCGVILTGAASGVDLCDFNGFWGAINDVPALGDVTLVAGDGVNLLFSDPYIITSTNAAPTIPVFTITDLGSNVIQFSGIVDDDAEHGYQLTVTLSGYIGVTGATATVQADGSWSVDLNLTGSYHGVTITANVTDWYGLSASNTANIP